MFCWCKTRVKCAVVVMARGAVVVGRVTMVLRVKTIGALPRRSVAGRGRGAAQGRAVKRGCGVCLGSVNAGLSAAGSRRRVAWEMTEAWGVRTLRWCVATGAV